MLRVLTCIAVEHDHILVALAAIICAVGAAITVRLLRRTITTSGTARIAWNFIGATAAGSTIWCTHFVGMLAYSPNIPVTYGPGLTIVSLGIAISGCAAAFAIARENVPYAPILGGIAFGVSTSAMHYTGMAAFTINGAIAWDIPYVIASVIASVVFGALAFHRIAIAKGTMCMITGAGFLMLAIVTMHFTGMAALIITPFTPEPGALTADSARGLIGFAITGISFLVLGTTAITYFLDNQARAHSINRLRYLAGSAVDGLVVTVNGRITEANAEFERMVGLPRETLLGTDMDRFLDSELDLTEGKLHTTELRATNGTSLAVEMSVRSEESVSNVGRMTVYALRDISHRLAQEQKISYLADFDLLTGLRHRASFIEKAADILQWHGSTAEFAVLAVDLNRFKDINDAHGHHAGDAVLKASGERLVALLTHAQLGARVGGDEFILFLEIDTREDAIAFAEAVEAELSKEITYQGKVLQCGASIGVSLAPSDGTEINELINNADLALNRAKSQTGKNLCLYDPGMDDIVRQRRKMTNDLKKAIAEGQLELFYQVQVAVPSEEIAGYEALVRWNHPELGLIPPINFISLAEETGLIIDLGEWVLRAACTEAATWVTDRSVSVNISAIQLNEPEFPSKVKAILAETKLPPGRLELEVTETCFIADEARAVAALNAIKAFGVSISIDDFGTGYSSLAMLQAFPFDKIKIDKSLIDQIGHNPKSKGVFRAVLTLGDALSVPILAEGVETRDQLDFLKAHGCQLVQGYLYGKPERMTAQRTKSRLAVVDPKQVCIH